MNTLRAWWDRQSLQTRLTGVIVGAALVMGWLGEAKADRFPLALFFGLLYIAKDCDRKAGHPDE